MLLEDHKRRVARLLRGERRISDLERLFSDLRMLKPGRESVQEIGHFSAHRDERVSGISHTRANNIQTSARLWQRQLSGVPPTVDELREAGRANLNIMPNDRIRERLGISRQTAKQSFEKAVNKFRDRKPLRPREVEILKVFGLSMMWQFAFDDKTLSADFMDLLAIEGALSERERSVFAKIGMFVTLYALSIMHGARLKMADGAMAQLRLSKSDSSGFLRIKAEIPIGGGPKPMTVSVSLFETSLPADVYCDPQLLTFMDEPVPVDIEGNRLVILT